MEKDIEMKKSTKRYIPKFIIDMLLVISLLVLIFLSYFFIYLLIWIAFVPLVLLAYRNSFVRYGVYLFIASLLTSFAYTSFIFFIKAIGSWQDYFLKAYIFVFLVFFITFLLYKIAIKKINYPYAIFLLPIFWFFVTLVGNLVPGGIAWFDISYLQPMFYPLTWICGAKGMTFLIMLVNSLVAFLIIFKDKKIIYSLIPIAIILLSCSLYSHTALPSGQKIKVALIQGNITSDWNWRVTNAASSVMDVYEKLTLEAIKSQPDIIVWPEYSIPNDIMNDQDLYNKIANLAKKANAYLVFGSLGKTEQTDPEYNYIRNLNHVFGRDGSYLGSYAEVFPLSFVEKVEAGEDFPIFSTDFGRFAINSCHDEEFNFVNKNYLKLGADFFIVTTNDYPIGSSWAIKSKSMHSNFSASENNRYVLRAANTGYTKIINPFGRVVASLEPNREGVLIADIYLK